MDPSGMPDGRQRIRAMGWEQLPYGCAGIVRKAGADGRRTVWSWLVLVPWSDDAKPWIDGAEVMEVSTSTEAEERATVFARMREILDERYGGTVANRAVDDLIERLLGDG